MKNFPRKLDSKTTNLRITVPENLDLALEGLIRKVLKEQPKTDDIYSFAADYFETLLKIRDKAGAKYMSSQICSFHNDEDAHEMIKLANSFPKPRTASDEGKSGHESGKSLPVRKSPVIRKPEKVSIGSRMMGDKRKRPVERIKPTTDTRNKTVAGFVKPVAEYVTKPSTEEPKVKDEKEDKLLTDLKSKLQDIDEDEELLTSDPIKELVERELMSKTQNDITRNKDQSSTDVPEKENLESEKAVEKVFNVVEPHENDQLKDELESKENREDEALIGDTTTTGDELCAVVDALSIPRAAVKENETATNQKEENKAELNLNESEKENTEEGEQVIETPKPEAEEAVTNESTSEKPEQVTDEKMKDLKEEKPEHDKMVKQDEDNEKKEIKDDEEKTKESTEVVEEGKEDTKEIKDNIEDDTEDIKDKSKDAEDIKDTSNEKDETDTTTDKKEEETSSETPKVEVEDDQDKPKEGAENTKGTSIEKEETDTTRDIKEEETPSETLKVEVKETEEAEKDPSDITQDNSNSVPDDSKKESSNEIEEKQTEGVTNQTSLPEENSPQVQTTKEETSNEKPSTDSEEPIKKQEDEEIKTQVGTEEPIDTTETNDTPTTESKLEQNDEIKVETKEEVEELPKTEGIVTSLDEGNKTTETDAENSKAVNETQPSDKEDKNQNEKLEDKGENHSKDVVVNDESLEETKEEEIKKQEIEPQSESIIKKEVEEEPAELKPEEETKSVIAEDEKKPDETEKPISENDQQEDKPEVIESSEEKPGGDIIENESKTEVKVEESKPIEEKPEVIDQEKSTKEKPEEAKLIEEEPKPNDQEKGDEKTEEVKLETEQVSNPEAGTEVTETGTKPKEDNNGESEESKQVETKEDPEKEFSPGSDLTADGETLDEKTVPEVEVVATEGKPKLDEEKETEKVSAQVNTKIEEEGIAVATPDQDDKDSVEHERQKRSSGEEESQAITDETKQTEETENLKDEENNRTTDNIQNNNIGGKESETDDNKIDNETKETVEENKPEDTNKDKVGGEEKTETRETITEITAEGELCTVVDTQNPTEPDETSKETAQPEDGITIKTITTHYYDLLQVPTTVTKEFKVHRTQNASLTQLDLSNVGNTIIKSYQFVKELTSDGDSNNNNPQTDSQDIKPDIGSTNQTEDTELEQDIQKDEIEDLKSIPTSGNLPELNLFTMHELFLGNERKLSSYQKEETKFSSLKNAKESLDDTKIRTESPKTPPTDEDKQEVEEIVTKTVIPRIPEAVPDPPREAEEINEETITEETENVKDKKEDDKPDANSSDDSNEPTDSSNNGRSIDSDVPIISVEVRTVIETQILDDDDEEEEGSEGIQKGGDCRTALTLTDGSNDVNVEVEATIQVPIDTADSVNGDNKNLTDQEKVSEQLQTKQQTNKHELPEGNGIKSSNEESEAGGSSTIRDGSSGESDSTTLTAVTQIKRVDSGRKNFARSSTQDLLTTQSLDSCKRPPLLKTRSLSVFRQGATDFEIWNTIEKELEEAATKIQSKYRGYTVRKRLRREDAVQITTEESSVSTTPVEQEPNLDQDNFRTTGEFHDSIVLSIHPR